MAEITHCPHCGKALWDERLNRNGFPKIDSIWEVEDGLGPAMRLRVQEVEPSDRLGRDVRGRVAYKTKNGGEDFDTDKEYAYATSLDIFHKIWVRDPDAPKDRSQFVATTT